MRIAYVEDEPDIRELTCLALETLGGYRVDAYSGGAAALDGVRNRPGPDLFLLDVMMPGLDGKALLRALRAMPDLADVPIIFMTAKSMPAEIEELLALGAVGVISKPFDPMRLPAEIEAHLRGAPR